MGEGLSGRGLKWERGAHRRTEPYFVTEGLAHSAAAKAAKASHSGDGWIHRGCESQSKRRAREAKAGIANDTLSGGALSGGARSGGARSGRAPSGRAPSGSGRGCYGCGVGALKREHGGAARGHPPRDRECRRRHASTSRSAARDVPTQPCAAQKHAHAHNPRRSVRIALASHVRRSLN